VSYRVQDRYPERSFDKCRILIKNMGIRMEKTREGVTGGLARPSIPTRAKRLKKMWEVRDTSDKCVVQMG